ncbi:hypothetical protein B1R94_02865 [Mycolicibacterium litorale]|nr:hypothetical protein B1R94_02865 [Mycolicibacterium litorale]
MIDWRRATLVGAITGGVFWGVAAGAILASHAAPAAIVAILCAAVIFVVVGVIVAFRSQHPLHRTVGVALILAPLTGAVPVLAVWLPGSLAQVISWRG